MREGIEAAGRRPRGQLEVVIGNTYPLSEAARAHEDQARRTPRGSCWTRAVDRISRPRALARDPARARRARLRADSDPGAGDSRAARGPRRDRAGADRHRQDRGLRAPAAPTSIPGDGAAIVLTPTRCASRSRRRCGRSPSTFGRGRRGVRRRPDPLAAGPASPRRARRGRDGGADDGPDVAQVARAHLGPLRRPRRGRRDARPRVHRGRRTDLPDVPGGRQTGLFSATIPPPDRPPRGRHVRPGDDPRHDSSRSTRSSRPSSRFPAGRRPIGLSKCLPPRSQSRRSSLPHKTGPRLDKTLRDRGLDVKALHGDMTQGQRDGVMISFKEHRLRCSSRRRRRAGPRHRACHPRDQLRRSRHDGRVRAPDRPHRPRGTHGPRDHPRHPTQRRESPASSDQVAIGEWEPPRSALSTRPGRGVAASRSRGGSPTAS